MKPLWSIFRFQPSKAAWDLPVLSGICIGVLLFGGWMFNYFQEAKLAALASLSILYFPIRGPKKKKFTDLIFAGAGYIVSYLLGVWIAGSEGLKPVWLGVFAALVFLLLQYLKMRRPPGTFFFVMLAAMAAFVEAGQQQVPLKFLFMIIGCLLAVIMAMLHMTLTIRRSNEPVIPDHRFVPHLHITEALVFGMVIALTCQLAISLELHSPYWAVVSCLAVLQGSSAGHVWLRSAQRFLGTLGGTLLIFGLIWVEPPFYMIILFIVFSQIVLEYLVSRNYAVAVVFVTILTIFFSVKETNYLESSLVQLKYRVIDISIGCMTGAAGGWAIYHYRLKRAVSRRVGRSLRLFGSERPR